jgi:hypothetical protein
MQAGFCEGKNARGGARRKFRLRMGYYAVCNDQSFTKHLPFQVDYDFGTSILNVSIIKCEDLAAMDIGGASDPYVKIYLLPDRKRKQETRNAFQQIMFPMHYFRLTYSFAI